MIVIIHLLFIGELFLADDKTMALLDDDNGDDCNIITNNRLKIINIFKNLDV